MNWYKKAEQGYLWGDDPTLPMANNVWESSGDFKQDIEEAQNIWELGKVFDFHQIPYEEVDFPNQVKLWVYDVGNRPFVVELSFPNPSVKSARDWIEDLGDYVFEYINAGDFSKQFWDEVGPGYTLYHGTSEENIDSILKQGLNPSDETRGLSNRSTGEAVFTSDLVETAKNYYDVVLEISVGRMKQDRYLIPVGKEEPIEEAEAKESLANKLGINDYYAEYEQGLDPGTIIFYGNIPPKYLRVV